MCISKEDCVSMSSNNNYEHLVLILLKSEQMERATRQWCINIGIILLPLPIIISQWFRRKRWGEDVPTEDLMLSHFSELVCSEGRCVLCSASLSENVGFLVLQKNILWGTQLSIEFTMGIIGDFRGKSWFLWLRQKEDDRFWTSRPQITIFLATGYVYSLQNSRYKKFRIPCASAKTARAKKR